MTGLFTCNNSDRCCVLFVAYGGGHVNMLAPIAQLMTDNKQSFQFLALTTAQHVLANRGIKYFGYRDLPEVTDAEALRLGTELARRQVANPAVPIEETIAYLGANYLELIDRYGEATAREQYAAFGRQAFLPINLLRKVLQRIRPKIVVATSSPRTERAAITAAGQLGIPSVCLVDLFATQEVKWIGERHYADRICVMNNSVREMLVDTGRLPEEIVVTGNPAFDPLLEHNAVVAGAELRLRRGWNDGRKVILWASQVEPERHDVADRTGDPSLPRRVEAELRRMVQADDRYRLVVRYHPSEVINFEPGPNVEFSPLHESIAHLVYAVDLVVVTASTVGLEASIAGCAVVSVDLSVFTPDTNFSKLGISHGIDSIEKLPGAIELALASHERRCAQTSPSETASEKVLEVINGILLSKGP
jgi:hypothetical protein